MNKSLQSLHPYAQRRERNLARRAARFEKLFGDAEEQDRRQKLHAEKDDKHHRERAAFERSLWNEPPPQINPAPGRVRKISKTKSKQEKKQNE